MKNSALVWPVFGFLLSTIPSFSQAINWLPCTIQGKITGEHHGAFQPAAGSPSRVAPPARQSGKPVFSVLLLSRQGEK